MYPRWTCKKLNFFPSYYEFPNSYSIKMVTRIRRQQLETFAQLALEVTSNTLLILLKSIPTLKQTPHAQSFNDFEHFPSLAKIITLPGHSHGKPIKPLYALAQLGNSKSEHSPKALLPNWNIVKNFKTFLFPAFLKMAKLWQR